MPPASMMFAFQVFTPSARSTICPADPHTCADSTATCQHEQDLTNQNHATTPEVIHACQDLWAPGSVPNGVDSFIGGEVTCRADAYMTGAGQWTSPRPAVCGTIEAAAASLGVGAITPGCALYFWCSSPEPVDGEIYIQWVLSTQQLY